MCIEGFDHHCVFFSKCIGGGNIVCFWGSMAMVAVNFIVILGTMIFSSMGAEGKGPQWGSAPHGAPPAGPGP